MAAFLLCACVLPVRKVQTHPVPTAKEGAVKLSPADAQKVEELYYKAVGAYSNNDLPAALEYLNEISALSASYRPAKELRENIRHIYSDGPAPGRENQ